MTLPGIEICTAKNLMSTNVLSVHEGWSVQRLAEFFLHHNITGSPVVSANQDLLGVVSVSDIFRFENADNTTKEEAMRACYQSVTGIDIMNRNDLIEWSKNAQQNCTVQQIMIPQVIQVDCNETLDNIIRLMLENDIHRVFVTSQGKINGVITTSDILRFMLGPKNTEAMALG